MKKYLLLLLFVGAGIPADAQTLNEIYVKSKKAYEAKDYASFLYLTQTLDSLRPSHPTFTYNLASAYALNGKVDEANAYLEKLVMTNNRIEFEKDDDFKSLQNSDDYKRIVVLKAELEKVVKGSQKVVSLSEKDLHPEGLLYLPKAKIWLASSIRKRKIVSFNIQTGKCMDWLVRKDMLAVFSMKADEEQKYLWVATAAIPEMENYSKEFEGKSEVLKIDLKTKEIVKRYAVKGNHLFGDLVVSKKAVYVTDSNNPHVYKIQNDTVSEWLNLNGEALNLQGITANKEGTKLFVADYLSGIVEVSVENNAQRSWLVFPKGTTQKGIDGLLFFNNTLIAIQNGVKPIRIVQYQLDKDQKQFKGFKIIDHNRPEFDEPALSAIDNNKLYFFSNSPWKFYSKEYKLDLERFQNPTLFSYDLLKK